MVKVSPAGSWKVGLWEQTIPLCEESELRVIPKWKGMQRLVLELRRWAEKPKIFFFFFFGTAIFPNSVGKTRKQFLKRLQSKRPSVLLAFILKEMKNYWFSEKIALKWWELSTSKEWVQRTKVWFRRVAADCALGLISSANVLLRGLHLRAALGSPASRTRQEFNESSQCGEHSLSLLQNNRIPMGPGTRKAQT